MLRIDINIVWTIINLIIFFLLIRKFLFKPIQRVIDERNKLIEDQFNSAEKAETEANALKTQYEDALKDAKDESVQIVESAKERAKVQSDEIVTQAQEQAHKMLEQSRVEVERQQQQALDEVEGQIANLAVSAAVKIISEASGQQVDEDMYQKYLDKVGDVRGSN